MMTAEEVTTIAGKAIEFVGAHAILRDGESGDIGRITIAMAAMTIVALADSKPEAARELTQAFMHDVESVVAHIVANAGKVPAP